MTRVSPPELASPFPGPHASSRVTRAPRRNRCNAVQPPNAPAPTTMTCGLGRVRTQDRASAAETADLTNVRREGAIALMGRGAEHGAPTDVATGPLARAGIREPRRRGSCPA